MIKDALKYIVGLGEAKEHVIHGDTYSDKELFRVDKHIPVAQPIEMNTLSSLVDYIKSNVDTMAEKMIIQVVDPREVKVFSQLNEKRGRETIARVVALIPQFKYETFIDHETFCISAQAKFLDDECTDKALMLQFAGTVENGSVTDYKDDGITQKATIRTGIASKQDAVVPNPVKLRPFRTFVEVEQPVSSFIFRMKDNHGICCALFEADGGAWKNVAMKNIKDYLEFELSDYTNQFIIIS